MRGMSIVAGELTVHPRSTAVTPSLNFTGDYNTPQDLTLGKISLILLSGKYLRLYTGIFYSLRSDRKFSPYAHGLYPVDRVLDQLGGILQSELLFKMCAVGLNGLYAEMQLRSDLAASMAPADQLKHL